MRDQGSVCFQLRRFRRIRSLFAVGLIVLFLFGAGSMAMAASGGGEHGAAPKGWVATDTYRVMNFAVLAIALFFLLRKPISQGLKSRVQGIKEQLAELEAQKTAAEAELAKYNERLNKLDEEARQIVEDYVQQGKEAKARIIEEAENTAEKLEEQAKRNIEHEFERIKAGLQAEVLEKALQKAEEIIQERITTEDQERLVDEYLEKVVA